MVSKRWNVVKSNKLQNTEKPHRKRAKPAKLQTRSPPPSIMIAIFLTRPYDFHSRGWYKFYAPFLSDAFIVRNHKTNISLLDPLRREFLRPLT